MSNLINRQDAIDALKICITIGRENGKSVALKIANDYADIVKKRIEELPSAQRWIPCSERSPEDGLYVVTDKYYDIDFLYYQRGRGWYHGNMQDIEGKPSVFAWMPLPEPWKGEQE